MDRGVEAVLPAHAAEGDSVGIGPIACPSADAWLVGVEPVLPADPATTSRRVLISDLSCHHIRSRDCSVGKIAHATSGKINPGHVISQRPGPGRRLTHCARVNLVVSKGRH
jgi:hypothetical protein